MLGQNNHEARTENRVNIVDGIISLNNANKPTQADGPQVDVHALEIDVISKVRSEVDSLMTMVETIVQDAALTAIKNLVVPRVELAMKSVNTSSGLGLGNFVLDPDWGELSGNVEGLQMTASNKINTQLLT